MNLYEKINAIMADVKTLKKDGKVAFGTTKYNFLSEAKTTEIFHELFVKHKIVLLPVDILEEKAGAVTQGRYTYRMINCENPEDYIDLMSGGQGQDSSDKGSGKASSYAYKYLLWRTFAIPSNDDPDQISNEETRANEEKAAAKKEAAEKAKLEKDNKKINKVEQGMLIDLIAETDSDANAMLKHYKITDVDQLTAKQYKNAIANYEKKKASKINE